MDVRHILLVYGLMPRGVVDAIGAMLVVFASFGARTASYPYDLPLGLFATLIGAPWLFALLLKKTSA